MLEGPITGDNQRPGFWAVAPVQSIRLHQDRNALHRRIAAHEYESLSFGSIGRMSSGRQCAPITHGKALTNVVRTKAHFEREIHLSRLPRRRTSLTVDILRTGEEGAVKQRVEEVSPQGPPSPLFQEKRKF